MYVCLSGYAFRHALRYPAESWHGRRWQAQEVCGHIFKATPPGVKGHPGRGQNTFFLTGASFGEKKSPRQSIYGGYLGVYARGALNFIFGECVPCGFQNVGSREQIFLKKWGSWERNVAKFWSRELAFWPKHGWKCKNFLKFENRGHERGTLTVIWWARERRLAWKKGVSWPRHIPIPLSNVECPPRFTRAICNIMILHPILTPLHMTHYQTLLPHITSQCSAPPRTRKK